MKRHPDHPYHPVIRCDGKPLLILRASQGLAGGVGLGHTKQASTAPDERGLGNVHSTVQYIPICAWDCVGEKAVVGGQQQQQQLQHHREQGAWLMLGCQHINWQAWWSWEIRIEDDDLAAAGCVGGRLSGPPELDPGLWASLSSSRG